MPQGSQQRSFGIDSPATVSQSNCSSSNFDQSSSIAGGSVIVRAAPFVVGLEPASYSSTVHQHNNISSLPYPTPRELASSLTGVSTTTTTSSSSALVDCCIICQRPGSHVRRKKTCILCHQQVCVDCIPNDPRTRNNRICSICQIITCNLTSKNQLEKLKTQHLVRFVDANRIDRRACQDKSELVELILRSRTQFHLLLRRALCQQQPEQSYQAVQGSSSHTSALSSGQIYRGFVGCGGDPITNSLSNHVPAMGSNSSNSYTNSRQHPSSYRSSTTNQSQFNSNTASSRGTNPPQQTFGRTGCSSCHRPPPNATSSAPNPQHQQQFYRGTRPSRAAPSNCTHNGRVPSSVNFSCNVGGNPVGSGTGGIGRSTQNLINSLEQAVSSFANGLASFANQYVSTTFNPPSSAGTNNPNQFVFSQTHHPGQPGNVHFAQSGSNIPAGGFSTTTTFVNDNAANNPSNNPNNSTNQPRQTTTTTSTRMTFGQAEQHSTSSSHPPPHSSAQPRASQSSRRNGSGNTTRRHQTRSTQNSHQGSSNRRNGLSNSARGSSTINIRPPSPPVPSVLIVDLKSHEDIERMTTKQMKELLNFHLVSIHGCIEQNDLREKVKELWEDEKSKRRLRDRSEKQSDGDSYMCKICMNDVVDCVLVECGHMVTCLDCGKRLQTCPICRQAIARVIKIFRS